MKIMVVVLSDDDDRETVGVKCGTVCGGATQSGRPVHKTSFFFSIQSLMAVSNSKS